MYRCPVRRRGRSDPGSRRPQAPALVQRLATQLPWARCAAGAVTIEPHAALQSAETGLGRYSDANSSRELVDLLDRRAELIDQYHRTGAASKRDHDLNGGRGSGLSL